MNSEVLSRILQEHSILHQGGPDSPPPTVEQILAKLAWPYVAGYFDCSRGSIGITDEGEVFIAMNQYSRINHESQRNMLFALKKFFNGAGQVTVYRWLVTGADAVKFLKQVQPYSRNPDRQKHTKWALEFADPKTSPDRMRAIIRLFQIYAS